MLSDRRFLGVDLAVDADGDLVISGGDIGTVELEENLRVAVGHRLVTSAGGLLHHPEYGAGLAELVGAVVSDSDLADFAAKARFELLKDRRLKDVKVTVWRGGVLSSAHELITPGPISIPETGDDETNFETTCYVQVEPVLADGQRPGNWVFPFATGGGVL